MQDRTRKLKVASREQTLFFESHTVRLVAMNGRSSGSAYEIRGERVTLGRGPGVDLAFDDSAMSRQHAVIEFDDGTFKLQDLGSTNGLRVNGTRVHVQPLKHGDRIELGTHLFQFLIEESNDPDTYELSV
jgi:pSer/pThr/pTyr-binding forkhead associated (FHA) protein